MRHYLAVLAICTVAVGWTARIQHAKVQASHGRSARDTLDIPSVIGPYRQVGPDQEISESVRQVLQTSAILMRTYRSPNGWPIQLTIVYAGETRRSLHFPAVCLVGQGWEVLEQSTMPIGFAFSASKLLLAKGPVEEAMLYWFKSGDDLTGDFFVNSWHWARNQLTSGAETSAMVRVSCPVGTQDKERAFFILEDFAVKLTPLLMENID